MKPVANFSYDINGLSVVFTDRSSNIPTSWNWDFGDPDSPDNTSAIQNPTHTFSKEGLFKVSLTVANADGNSTFTYNIIVTSIPNIGVDILTLVKSEIPSGLATDINQFNISVRKWQLYIGPLLSPKISDADIFNQSKYPPLVNVLISKLIVYDIVMKASAESMTSYYNAVTQLNSVTTDTTTVSVADYTVPFKYSDIFELGNVVVNQIQINGIQSGPSPNLADANALLTWLNGLDRGQFAFDETGDNLVSLGNVNILTDFNYTDGTGAGHNLQFASQNPRVVSINFTQTTSGGSSSGVKGSVKKITTGPSSVEWNDASSYWTAMFKSSGNTQGVAGSGGGIFQNIVMDICSFASRVRVKLPMCPGYVKKSAGFIVSKNTPITYPCFYKPPSQG